MASSSDSWIKEYYEASKLADDINGMISQRISLPTSGSETQRHASAIRRKITILGTRLDSLQSLLLKLPGKQPITEKEMNRRKDMLSNLRSKVSQMASTLNMSNFANRDSLLGPEIKPADAMSRTTGLDNQGLVGLQRQIMKGYLGPACRYNGLSPGASAEEPSDFEQADQGRLHLLLHAFIGYWNCDSDCCDFGADKILVIQTVCRLLWNRLLLSLLLKHVLLPLFWLP
ncbi:syntaxin-51 isoform X3 [Vitis vinifera]|uniref:syntaxin-51 isoform X3 n=1 Tax=Vitis vinifera TaxID=29760 RepID=UPI002883417D|nr:syntaxin-51 isoform X3 [Vitis vinifera]